MMKMLLPVCLKLDKYHEVSCQMNMIFIPFKLTEEECRLPIQTWAYRKVKIRGAETNLPDFPHFARQVPKKFSGEKLF
jgi:hypothetical protein